MKQKYKAYAETDYSELSPIKRIRKAVTESGHINDDRLRAIYIIDVSKTYKTHKLRHAFEEMENYRLGIMRTIEATY